MNLSSIFAGKSRKVPFEVDIEIDSLVDVPLMTGRFFIRWKMRNVLNDQSGSTSVYLNLMRGKLI